MTQPQTPLGKKQIQASNGAFAAVAETKTALGRVVSGRRGEMVDLPILGSARIELIGEIESQAVEAEVYRAMRKLELDLNPITIERFELERATRILARCVMDPADPANPFGTLAEWGALDNDIINACWHVYGDVRERLDPMSQPLSDEERIAIELAVKKKHAGLLRSFGVAKLSGWLATTDVLPPTSPPPSSSSSASESDS